MIHELVIKTWKTETEKLSKLFDELSEEQLMQQIAPGKNRGIYLLGHLTAVNDNILSILGVNERVCPELDEIFIYNPDNENQPMPSVESLMKCWHKVNENLSACFAAMNEAEWLQRHSKVSEADFLKEPHRNKLNVLLSRITHQSYHLGQLVLLKNK